MADPVPIVRTLQTTPLIKEHFGLRGTITLADAKNIRNRLKDEGSNKEAFSQIMFADRIILNKVDIESQDLS